MRTQRHQVLKEATNIKKKAGLSHAEVTKNGRPHAVIPLFFLYPKNWEEARHIAFQGGGSHELETAL